MRIIYFLVVGLMVVGIGNAQQKSIDNNWWRVELSRNDGHNIVFNFEWKQENGKPVWYIRNAEERMRVTDIQLIGDSILVHMPVFESQFKLKKSGQEISGVWIKAGAIKPLIMPFHAVPGKERFPLNKSVTKNNIGGRWSASFKRSNREDETASVAEFVQQGDHINGSFLKSSGDSRYLEGGISNDSLLLSGFDGVHAYLFTARIKDGNHLEEGWEYSTIAGPQKWTAEKNAAAVLSVEDVEIKLKPGQERLNFTFKDLDGHPVSINDERFKNKVVVVEIMGSWCPNCMDEMAFFSDYYKKNRQRGIEFVALAYEYSTDVERSTKSLKKFQQKFDVQYTMLNTGVAITDTLLTEKTLPQITPIKNFPSTIVLDKTGRVRKLEAGFNGPATGIHYLEYIKDFEATIDGLLKEGN
jgi:thiol-disulfide isomerase/thioredoxin